MKELVPPLLDKGTFVAGLNVIQYSWEQNASARDTEKVPYGFG